MNITAGQYDHWYHTARGQWISETEFYLLMRLLQPRAGARLLDVGCGTGHFSRRFVQAGLEVTGIDPDNNMLDYAREQSEHIEYQRAGVEELPFEDGKFDYCAAVTSLCFVTDPVKALQEMWRVGKYGLVMGLLNRHSLLHRQKAGQGAYADARWDSRADVINWLNQAGIPNVHYQSHSAIFLPHGAWFARLVEKGLPVSLPWGGFLAIALHKTPVKY